GLGAARSPAPSARWPRSSVPWHSPPLRAPDRADPRDRTSTGPPPNLSADPPRYSVEDRSAALLRSPGSPAAVPAVDSDASSRCPHPPAARTRAHLRPSAPDERLLALAPWHSGSHVPQHPNPPQLRPARQPGRGRRGPPCARAQFEG